MGLLDKFKMQKKVFKQDTTQIAEHSGMVFIVHLLMEEMSEMPEKEHMHATISKHLGETDYFCHDGKVAGFAPRKYLVHFEKENKDIPPQLMITNCTKIEKPIMDDIACSLPQTDYEGKDTPIYPHLHWDLRHRPNPYPACLRNR